MKLEAFDIALKRFQEINGISNKAAPAPVPGPEKAGGFAELFENAVKEADNLSKIADQQVEGLTLGQSGYTMHGAMLALEKADSAFQLMNNIRAKIIRAYEDVIRTQV